MIKECFQTNERHLKTDHSITKAKCSISQNTDQSGRSSSGSSGNSRSIYLCGNKLTRSSLFSSIQGRKGSLNDGHDQRGLEVQLLQDTLIIAQGKENELLNVMKCDFRSMRDEGRKMRRLLEHLTQSNFNRSSTTALTG